MAHQRARGSRELADTIAAPATPPGTGAIAVVRLSGPDAAAIARRVTGRDTPPRAAAVRAFKDSAGEEIDRGLVIYFPAPRSYTGEDVVELHCHGAPAIVDWLLETLYAHGARPARPGEFTLRAFLHDKLDLAQAEAVADLVAGGSRLAVRAALRSLTGEFSARVQVLQERMTDLRAECEAWLDFPDEDIDRAAQSRLHARALDLERELGALCARAEQGAVLRDGLAVAIAGPPNAGKSSLLNRLAARDAAIVAAVPGTTRDAIRERVSIDGLPLEVVDTAGLRDTADAVEVEGVRRARREIENADLVLFVADIRAGAAAAVEAARAALPAGAECTILLNKVDLEPGPPRTLSGGPFPMLEISALTGEGIDALGAHLKARAGWNENVAGAFSARRRHLDALARAQAHVARAAEEIEPRLEIAAEELRAAQTALSEVTGEITSDDLLGEIFARFCIGK